MDIEKGLDTIETQLSAIAKSIWIVDTEFRNDHELQIPVCLVAHEIFSDRVERIFFDRPVTNPFGTDYCMVAHNAVAELCTFLRLGWDMPNKVLCLMQEFKMKYAYINEQGRWGELKGPGAWKKIGTSLLDVLKTYGLTHLMGMQKQAMIDFILATPIEQYTDQDREDVLDYCESDVIATKQLFLAMLPDIERPGFSTGYVGEYLKAISVITNNGVPFDTQAFQDVKKYHKRIKSKLIQGSSVAHIYRADLSFDEKAFANWVLQEGWAWEKTKSGKLTLDQEYMRKKADTDPRLNELHNIRGFITNFLRLDYQASSDGFLRAPLWAFGSNTGRNQPTSFIYGAPKWVRSFMRAQEGCAIAYLDWKSQEVALAAGLSGDTVMKNAYEGKEDFYLTTAKMAGRVPANGELAQFKRERNDFKNTSLGMQYGQQPEAISEQKNLPLETARFICQWHRKTFNRFWLWSDNLVAKAFELNMIQTILGWKVNVPNNANPRALLNFNMQAHGAHCLQLAAIELIEAGIFICAPVHDAFLIMAPIDKIEEDVEKAKAIMVRVGTAVAKGVKMKVDAEIWRYPYRYSDGRGFDIFQKIMQLVQEEKALDFWNEGWLSSTDYYYEQLGEENG